MVGCLPAALRLLLALPTHCCGARPVALRRPRRDDPARPPPDVGAVAAQSIHCGPPKKLPTWLWVHVAEFLQCGVVAELCAELRGVLQWRHVVCKVNNKNLQQKVDLLQGAAAVHAVALQAQCLRVGEAEARVLATLGASASLTALNLNLRFTCLEDRAIPALCQLRTAPCLTSLAMDLGRNHLEDAGAQALTALRECPTLTTLDLSLRCNQIGNAGAAALAALGEAPALTTLSLDLDGNHVDDAGLQGLVGLAGSPTLRCLTLLLSYNSISDVGALGLTDLGCSTTLSTLHLHLRSNQIGDAGAKALAALMRTPSLHHFSLDLRNNAVGRKGRNALKAAFKGPRLRCHLQLVDEEDAAGPPQASPLGLLAAALSRWHHGYQGLLRDSAGSADGATPASTPKP